MPNKSSATSRLNVKLDASILIVGNDLVRYEWTRGGSGLPSVIRLAEDKTGASAAMDLWTERKGSGKLQPCLDRFDPQVSRKDDALIVVFDRVPFVAVAGKTAPDFTLSLRYELYPDGAAFVTTFFNAETADAGMLGAFMLQANLTLGAGESANWAYWKLPNEMSGKLIQDLGGFERYLTQKEGRRFEKTILPFVSFDYGVQDRRDRHLEFFVESWNSLTLDPGNTATEIAWRRDRACISWNFQRRPVSISGRGYHWRNTWGWCLRRFPVVRRRPPMRVFHYLDNFEQYPSGALIRQVAAQGADTLIVHENWRRDYKNGEFAGDPSALRGVVAACRRHNLRLGLYVRGNDDAIREDFAAPLRPYLKRNRDGIYMDFGTPICYLGREEYAPGGRVHFREYYRMLRRLREFVGHDGFIVSHSGSFFSALGHTLVDAYLGGEQEKGRLIENPTAHAYFSGLSVAPSSLWTAAFPTYRTSRVLPYLAMAGQFPFLHLGVQFPTSSLAHSKVPSAIRFARPLWRLWELFDGQTDIRMFSTQGTGDMLRADSSRTGACVLADRRGNALVIASNLSDKPRAVAVRPLFRAMDLPLPRACVELRADKDVCSCADVAVTPRLTRRVPGYGIAAWLLSDGKQDWRKPLARFTRPFSSDPVAEGKHACEIDDLRRRRFDPPAWKECYLRVWIPDFPNTYEESVWRDLFDNTVELQDCRRVGASVRLGYLTLKGLTVEKPVPADYLRPGFKTPWVALHKVAKSSRGKPIPLALATRRGANEFYSFVKAELADGMGKDAQRYEIEYHNDIDLDWSVLSFRINLA